jgi:hypothetical protein
MIPALFSLIGFIFGAGGAWVKMNRIQTDQKGMGAKINRNQAEADRKVTRLERLESERYSATCLAILAAVPEEKRSVVAGLLKIGATL